MFAYLEEWLLLGVWPPALYTFPGSSTNQQTPSPGKDIIILVKTTRKLVREAGIFFLMALTTPFELNGPRNFGSLRVKNTTSKNKSIIRVDMRIAL